jgi:hypothetical protein
MRYPKSEIKDATETLQSLIKPGMTIRCILRRVSRSGMSRVISIMVIKDNETYPISWAASRVLGWPYDAREQGVKVGGCGMDMGFHLVYSLGCVIFPEGGPVEHSQRRRQEEREGSKIERNGGYLLRHEWI